MTAQLVNVTFDCDDVARLAAFWSEVLGRPIGDDASEHFASLAGSEGSPTLLFLKVPETKSAKNRVHVELHAEDRTAEVARLIDLGAARVDEHTEYGMTWVTLRDPEGNEFCVA